MKSYSIEVSFNDPYPKTNRFRMEGSNLPAVTGKALRAWRKEHKGRKIKKLTINIQQL